MKKILSTAIAALFLLQNLAFAEVNNGIIRVDCLSQPKLDFCKAVNITKEKIRLKSTLNQYYLGYLYNIENNGNFPIEITDIYGNKAFSAIEKIKTERKNLRFPSTLQGIFGLPITGVIGFPIYLFFGPYTIEGKKTSAFTYVYILPIKNTILAPYYLIKDPRDDEKAKKEVSQFENKFEPLTLSPNAKVRIPILVGRSDCLECGWSTYSGKIFIVIKDTETGKIYQIQK